jgi:hypothetical protein
MEYTTADKKDVSVQSFPYFMLTIYIAFPKLPRNSVCKLFIIVSSTKQNAHTYIKNLHTYDWRENKLNLANWVYRCEISESACLRLICILRKSATYLASNMSSKSCWTPSELASALCHVSWLVTILSISWMNTWPSDSANFIMNSIAELPWPPTNFISSQQWIQICLYSSNKNLGKILYNQYAEFLLHFQKRQEVMKWLALKRVLLEGIWSLEISKLIQEHGQDPQKLNSDHQKRPSQKRT